jgi:hypothetical protein
MAQRKRKVRADSGEAVATEAVAPEPRRRRGRVAVEPGSEPPETLAHELIPAAPSLSPPRAVGPRRVAGHDTVERLLARRGFRPAGNSRRFWTRVEDDDPFLPQPKRWDRGDESATVAATGAASSGGPSHEPYAADRLSRMGKPKNKPDRPATAAPRPSPEPRAPAPGPAPRPAARPPPRPAPPAPQAERPAPVQPIDRRPPLIRNAHLGEGAAAAEPRGPEPTVRQRLVDPTGRSAEEVRREREAARAGGPTAPPARSFDDVMSLMSQLRASEELYLQGLKEEATEAFKADEDAAAIASTPRRGAPPPAAPPEPHPEPAPVDRSPRRASGAANLDDLFGGGEGRVRIGRRTATRPKPDE